MRPDTRSRPDDPPLRAADRPPAAGRGPVRGAGAGRSPALGGLYAAYYAALGAFFPFLPLFYRAHGLSGLEIGALAAVSPALALFAQPLWAGIADARGQRRGVLLCVLAGSGAAAPLFLLARGFPAYLLCAAALALCSTSVAPLADSLTIVHLGGARERYARVRLWGAAGFALCTAAMGALLLRQGLAVIFIVYSAGIAAALLLATLSPPGVAPPSQRRRLWDALPELWRATDYRAFVGVACVLQLASSANNAFLSLYVHALGSSTWVIGLAWAVAAAFEVPVMALAPRFAERLGPRRVLTLALGVYALRYALFGALAARGPAWILGLQLGQGLSFGLFYTTAVPYVSRLAPAHLQTSAQAVYAAATQGATAIIGTLLAGLIFDAFGPQAVYAWASAAAAVAAVTLLVSRLPLAPGREGGRATASAAPGR